MRVEPVPAVSVIRAVAIAVIVRPRDGALLVFDAYDAVKGEAFHRPLGGAIEFGETGAAAVTRELREEIGAELADVTYLGFVENLFEWNGVPGHEMVVIFSARLTDESLYDRDEIPMNENGQVGTALWVRRDAFRSAGKPNGPALYPEGLLAIVPG